MYRNHTCGELRISDVQKEVILSGWIQKVQDLGSIQFINLRDRYGITQLVIDENSQTIFTENDLGREYVIQAKGMVRERSSKNPKLATGDIEVLLSEVKVLNASEIPPFTIEDDTDGGEELRMKYRYLDLRRAPIQQNMLLRVEVNQAIRDFLSREGFLDIETPYLIKSTPEGARDFVVPSRLNEGEFYALPQSPQTFKQLLMVSGFDKYYQIVKCFRDEDLRADRQPEFTQIDCEMSFVQQEDILQVFERMIKHLLAKVKGINYDKMFPRMTWDEAMRDYGNDKPDIRFGMKIHDMREAVEGAGFKVFDDAEVVLGICVQGQAEAYTRKKIDALTEWVKRPQLGMKGLVYMKCNEDGMKSSVDKFYDQEKLQHWAELFGAHSGDIILVLAGEHDLTYKAAGELRLHIGEELGLRNPEEFAPLWVLDFPLLEYDKESDKYVARHHPFTSPKSDEEEWLSDPSKYGDIKANAYDMVLNGHEIGGGSIRIYQRELQEKMFQALGIDKEEAQEKFGFLLDAFRFGAPPHGGIAFGLDRIVALLGGDESIREYIAFPKNNSGRDVMIDTPSALDQNQLDELHLKLDIDNAPS